MPTTPPQSHGVLSSGCPVCSATLSCSLGASGVQGEQPEWTQLWPLLVGRGALSNWVPSAWRQVQLFGSASVTSCLPAGVLTL